MGLFSTLWVPEDVLVVAKIIVGFIQVFTRNKKLSCVCPIIVGFLFILWVPKTLFLVTKIIVGLL